jgi:predicted nuclease with TOPRIM domain
MREPKNTCPAIDRGIDMAETIASHAKDIEGYLEELRKQNEELREWGNYWKDAAEEAQAEVKSLEKELQLAAA